MKNIKLDTSLPPTRPEKDYVEKKIEEALKGKSGALTGAMFKTPALDLLQTHASDCQQCFGAVIVHRNDPDRFCLEGLLAWAKSPPWYTANGNLTEEQVQKIVGKRAALDLIARME